MDAMIIRGEERRGEREREVGDDGWIADWVNGMDWSEEEKKKISYAVQRWKPFFFISLLAFIFLLRFPCFMPFIRLFKSVHQIWGCGSGRVSCLCSFLREFLGHLLNFYCYCFCIYLLVDMGRMCFV